MEVADPTGTFFYPLVLSAYMPTLLEMPAPESAAITATLQSRLSLNAIFYPKSIAVVGATDKPASVGRTILRNLLDQPSGATIFRES
jgi:hypothetical protein